MTPRISVVLPVFNGAQFLPACLESIFSQTQTDFEVVAADDGSTDASQSILAACGDPRLRVLPDQPRQGLFRTMNRLIAEAKAPLIKPLCQDDQMLPSCLAETCAFMDQHPDIDMLFHKTVTIDQHDRVIEEASVTDLPPVLSPSEAGQHFFFHGCIPGNLSTVAFRRRAFDVSGGFDVRYHVAGDYELWVRLCRDRGLGVLQRRLLKLRTHPGQLSRARSSGLQFIIENRRIRRTILPRLALAQRKQAIRFEQERHHVLEWHYAMRTLSAFRPMEFARVVRTLGLRDSLAGSLNWLLSGNNRWRRPVPPFE